MSFYLLLDILFAYILDIIVGDPYWMPHPVRFIGLLINKTEQLLRKNHNNKKENLIAGIWLLVIVSGSTFIIIYCIIKIAWLISPILFHVVNVYFMYSAFATKCLGNEAMKIYKILKRGDLKKAQEKIGMLVGRDTQALKEKDIVRAVVETTAENTVDGIVSPILYAFVGSLFGLGAPIVYVFKAVSTLDSMVGYMNEKYIDFGRASAKMDDLLNYIPARITGILIVIASTICGENAGLSFKIMIRDRKNHKSPNCAYPEAAIAGALGVLLGGNNYYFGSLVEKPTIGDNLRDINTIDIKKTVRIMYVVSVIIMTLLTITAFILFI